MLSEEVILVTPLFTDFLKTVIPFEIVKTNDLQDVDEPLLISIPNSEAHDGLVLLERDKLYKFALSSCTGLFLNGDQLFVSSMYPDCMKVTVYEPGKQIKTIVSGKLGDIHDIRFFEDELYVVSTGTNEVATVDMAGRVRKTWKMDGFGDSCHINCLDIWDGRLVATAFGNFSTYGGYKGTKGSGIVLDVKTQEVLSSGFSSPHTPRRDEKGGTYICDSGAEGVTYNYGSEKKVLSFPGSFPRGLALTSDKLYVGLSGMRNRTDGGSDRLGIASAQVAIVDRNSFEVKQKIALPQIEIYDILVVRN